MSADYEAEQRELKDRAAALQGELDKAQEADVYKRQGIGKRKESDCR